MARNSTPSSLPGRSRRRRHTAIATLLTAALASAATACGGSALSPQYVQAANDALQRSVLAGAGTGSTVTNPATGGTITGPATGGTVTNSGTGGTVANPGSSTSVPGSPSNPGGHAASVPGITAGSCTGFKNQTGITDKTITIGNSSDISGPVPGIFTASQQAVAAYVDYFNATSSICGRKLALTNLDSRTDAGADQGSYQKMCDTTFASIGSMSAFDSGGSATAQSCGLPDIRTAAVTAARNACSSCFGAQSTGPHEFSNEVPDFFVKNYHAASQKAAFLYLNAGAAVENAKTQQAVETKRGMHFVYTSAIDVADFNYGPYVQAMKSAGVQWVQFIGAYQQSVRLAQAMQQGGFNPQVRLFDPSIYDPAFLSTGGSAVEGAFMFINFTPLNQNQTELNLYKQWLQQVAPGAQPTFFGEFAWSAAKLFVEQAIALGGNLTRASLVARIRGIHAWTGGGMHSPMDVGGKHAPSCIRFLQVKNGQFAPLGSTAYTCHGVSTA